MMIKNETSYGAAYVQSTSQPSVMKPIKEKTLKQLVIERGLRADGDAASWLTPKVTVTHEDHWHSIFSIFDRYDLNKLIRDGWKVVSLTKAFFTQEGQTFGTETAILERYE